MPDRDLPGWPTKRLVKRVRSQLWRFGIRPKEPAWTATWRWASAIADSYFHRHWPLAHEIGAQYTLLLLGRMQEGRSLKLPFRADKVMPDEVRQLLPATPVALPSVTVMKRIEQESEN
jgi:hypothetical protein